MELPVSAGSQNTFFQRFARYYLELHTPNRLPAAAFIDELHKRLVELNLKPSDWDYHAHFPRCENLEIVVKAPWKKDSFFQHVDYLGLESTTEKRQCLFDILKGMFEIREASAMRLNRDAIGNRLQSQPATGRKYTMDRGSRGI